MPISRRLREIDFPTPGMDVREVELELELGLMESGIC